MQVPGRSRLPPVGSPPQGTTLPPGAHSQASPNRELSLATVCAGQAGSPQGVGHCPSALQ